jgi:riboflavin kinase/FMN adenylyltransferase
MKILIDKQEVKSIAIGRFDGFHLGHKRLFQKLDNFGAILMIDKERDFFILPRKFANRYIDLPIFKYQLSTIRDLDGRDFIERLRRDFPSLKKVVVGYDFRFGRDRKFSAFDLKEFSDLDIEIVDEVLVQNISVHSGEIIKRLKNGEIDIAKKLLGRNFSIIGEHEKGQGLGKREFVPTINIKFEKFVSPKEGVYLSKTVLKGEIFDSISFVGIRETTDGSFALETHILDRDLEVENFGEVEVFFTKFIRENRKFSNLADLKEQISKDISIAKSCL